MKMQQINIFTMYCFFVVFYINIIIFLCQIFLYFLPFALLFYFFIYYAVDGGEKDGFSEQLEAQRIEKK